MRSSQNHFESNRRQVSRNSPVSAATMRQSRSLLSCLPRGYNITPFVAGNSHASSQSLGSSPIDGDLVQGHPPAKVCLPPRWLLLLLLWWWSGGDVPEEHIVSKGGLLVRFRGVVPRFVLCTFKGGKQLTLGCVFFV